MRILIETVAQKFQRYDTLGDWYYDKNGDLHIVVTNDDPGFPTEDHQFLIALHELVELYLCKKRGITQAQVDTFDLTFTGDGEPGDHPDAPYRKEHRFAMIIEHLMAHELGMKDYGSVA